MARVTPPDGGKLSFSATMRWPKSFGLAMATRSRFTGEFDCQAYKTDAGEDRQSWSIMVDAVLSARAKPKKAKPSQDNPQPFDTKRWEGGPGDGIPF
jgi:hypothetical protein